MASLNMGSYYEFTEDMVDMEIEDGRIGNYALGDVDSDGAFIVYYVGRSDTDVKERIKKHIGEHAEYKYFMFSYATSSKEAYLRECNNWHDFGEFGFLYNSIHPDKPNGTDYRCPRCLM